jgi:hypothetical protein
MDETIFDYLERTRLVDYVLAAAAIVGPVLQALLAALLRDRDIVKHHRHQWALGLLAFPTLFILWLVYNYIMDLYGLDSVFALLLNAGIFIGVALVYVLLERLLYQHFYGKEGGRTVTTESSSPESSQDVQAQNPKE